VSFGDTIVRWLIWVTKIVALRSPSPAQGPEIRSIFDTAHSGLPEFAADLLITLVDAGLISDRPKNIELLSEAYGLALGAHPSWCLSAETFDNRWTWTQRFRWSIRFIPWIDSIANCQPLWKAIPRSI